ncbi:MAG TPA: DUF6498-containing protein [Rhodanobacteraceae bacterium]|jgi:hypothetical protein
MSSTAPRQIPLPPLSQHLREFASRRDAWLILARNLIPVVGIYFFGWSAAVAVFSYWFDGLVGVSAIIAALVPRASRESYGKTADPVTLAVLGVVTWAFLVAILGLPYWIVLIPLHDLLLGDELRQQIMTSHSLWASMSIIVVTHFWKAFQAGYDTMPEPELKQRARWDMYLLVLRAIAMFMMASHGLAFIMVPLLALLLTYFEVWPERVLGAVFGDPSKLYEHDPDDGTPRKPKRRS